MSRFVKIGLEGKVLGLSAQKLLRWVLEGEFLADRKSIGLSEREFISEFCELKMYRDENASRNIDNDIAVSSA